MSYVNNWRAQNREINNLINDALQNDTDGNVQFINNEVESLCSESANSSNCSFDHGPIENISVNSNTSNFDYLSDTSFDNDEPIIGYSLSEELASWAAWNKCTRACINELLEILINNGHNDLPKDSRILIKTPHIHTLPLSGEEYVYLV